MYEVAVVDKTQESPGKWARVKGAGLRLYNKLHQKLAVVLAALFVALFVAFPQFVSHASTTITIDTDILFSSVNDWITVFLPIAAIGLGIAIALAVIDLVGDSILMGFKRRH